MGGIYVHIPFCKQACTYCDFHFSTTIKNKRPFLTALKNEIERRKDYFLSLPENKNEKITTIYLGGGTPSLLVHSELMDIFELLYKHFEIDSNAEITLEANPDDLTKEKTSELKHSPVNRLSIGIQSFYEEDLLLMNRAHNGAEALQAVKYAQDNGFTNISIDLIYGSPSLSHLRWENNLKTAFELNVKHISAYCLTVEPKTVLAKLIERGKIIPVDEQHSSEQFEIMLKGMKNNDFQQYEISNFCKDQYYSKHNSNYWLKEKYLGLGPSAHSYDGLSRQWNKANTALYIHTLDKHASKEEAMLVEKEILTLNQRYNEYVLTSLRTMWGTDLSYIHEQFGQSFYAHFLKESAPYNILKQLVQEKNKMFLTDQGKLFADKIASDLFKI